MVSKTFYFLFLALAHFLFYVHASQYPINAIDQAIKASSRTYYEEIINESHTIIANGLSLAKSEKAIRLRCGSIFPGWNPFGYGITKLGLEFLEWDGSLDSDIGRFLASFKSGRKREKQLKQQWLEIVRVSKQGQSMRIYRKMDDLLAFCVKAGFLS